MIALFSHFCQVYTESRGLTSQTEIWPIKGLWDLLELHWTEWALLFWTHSGLHFPGITSSFYTHSAAVPGHSMNGYFDNQLLLPWYKNIKFKLKVNYNKQKHIVHWFKHYTDCFLCYGHLHSGILRHYFFFVKLLWNSKYYEKNYSFKTNFCVWQWNRLWLSTGTWMFAQNGPTWKMIHSLLMIFPSTITVMS